MSRRSVFAVKSFGLGRAAPYAPAAAPAADPATRPPSDDPPIDPPGAGADAESDMAFGVIAHPARIGAVTSIEARAICEKRFTRVPPFREPWMGPRFGRGPRRRSKSAHPMPGACRCEIWCNIRQLVAGLVRPSSRERHGR